MKIIKPPHPIHLNPLKNHTTIFLAGSIEMGAAVDWQTKLADEFLDDDVTFYNPRRVEWDNSWKQEITNPQFHQQVNWELNALDAADIIIMYFDPNTKSPISLLELGLYANSGKLLVCCPEGFWRKGNVDIVCDRYSIPNFKSLEDLIVFLKKDLEF